MSGFPRSDPRPRGHFATAAAVYQNSPAVAQGSYQTFTDTLNLTVRNTLPDNFGTYAADGIHDDWQVLYFGIDNPDAGPAVDPDFDGQNNLFEFTAGIVPTDPNSRFLINAQNVSGQPSHRDIVFSPRFTDRTYTVQTSPTLTLSTAWTDLTTIITSDNGTIRTVTDTDATGLRKFYQVEIIRP